jgi:hypothetical protein
MAMKATAVTASASPTVQPSADAKSNTIVMMKPMKPTQRSKQGYPPPKTIFITNYY